MSKLACFNIVEAVLTQVCPGLGQFSGLMTILPVYLITYQLAHTDR